ncbi:MAG: N-formylglutamate amidohydrolase [Deltaproteobacteria bacterium]|nr:N-formylglutamate amidohydrolase [Deltaproteobacteria bacterium]
MKLPFLVSVPHAGLSVPQEVQDICILTPEQIYDDSDVGAAEIFFELEQSVESFVTSDVARAIVDLNRATDDFRKDGVIKTHTCYDIPVYSEFPSKKIIEHILTEYYHPYHQKLKKLTNSENIKVGIDCHTMAAMGPPISPDAGKNRPLVCLSNAHGTCPDEWLLELSYCFQKVFPHEKVQINKPFRGGYIIRTYSYELPWLQIELSRTEHIFNVQKRDGVLEALNVWENTIFKN